MKYRYTCAILVVFAALLLLALAAQAQVGVPSDVVKYSQAPKTTSSFDFTSMQNGDLNPMITMDDWVCPDGRPITDVEWWGSYWVTPSNGVPTPYSAWRPDGATGVDGFTIGIFPNLAVGDLGNPNGFAIPDLNNALWLGDFEGNAGETFAFSDQKNVKITETVYSYGVNLADATDIVVGGTSFQQVEGQTYWLLIAANMSDATRQWGWHEANSITGAYAVQATLTDTEEIGWYIPCGGHDMAFQLTTVPEPGSLMALGVGLASLMGLISRRRRSE